MTLNIDVVKASHALVSSALSEMDTISEDQAHVILTILAGTIEVLKEFGLTENTKDIISTAISAAFILGKRDAQSVPDAFSDMLSDSAT